MASSLVLDLGGVGALSIITLVLVVSYLRRRTLIRCGAMLIAALLTLIRFQATLPWLIVYCSRGRPHVDCIPDRFDGLATRLMFLISAMVPTNTHLAVAAGMITAGLGGKWYWRHYRVWARRG